jgi:hypothetical protein
MVSIMDRASGVSARRLSWEGEDISSVYLNDVLKAA